MDETNCDKLFEYLRSILYDAEIEKLDIDSLDEPFRKLGMGLQFLAHAVREMKQYTAALAARQSVRALAVARELSLREPEKYPREP